MSHAPAYPVEVANPRWMIWLTVGGCGVIVMIFSGPALHALLSGRFSEDSASYLTFVFGSLLFSLWACARVIRARTLLFSDRVERRGMFMSKDMQRSDVLGYVITKERTIRLVDRRHRGRGLTVSPHVRDNPAWIAWLNTLPDLDVQDAAAEDAALLQDARLGEGPTERRSVMRRLRHAGGVATALSFAAAGWLILSPGPHGLAVAINVLIPVLALVAAWRWPGAVDLTSEEGRLATGAAHIWMMPSLALCLSALSDFVVIDRTASYLVALAVMAFPWVSFQALCPPARRGIAWGLISLFGLSAWGWGGAVLVNRTLDLRPPVLVHATVLHRWERSRRRARTRSRFVSVETTGRVSEVIERIPISAARYARTEVQSTMCLELFPGALGLRYVVPADCPGMDERLQGDVFAAPR